MPLPGFSASTSIGLPAGNWPNEKPVQSAVAPAVAKPVPLTAALGVAVGVGLSIGADGVAGAVSEVVGPPATPFWALRRANEKPATRTSTAATEARPSI